MIGAVFGGALGLVFTLALRTVPGALLGALFGSAVDAAEAVAETSSEPDAPERYLLLADAEIAAEARSTLAAAGRRVDPAQRG